MSTQAVAGKPAPQSMLTDIPALTAAYYVNRPEPDNPLHRVSFGTSGHRGVSFNNSFNEPHILAVTKAVCEYRAKAGIRGPLFIGMDTHALSRPAMITALEVLAAEGVEVMYQAGFGWTPTPVVSHAILNHNRGKPADAGNRADGIVITPSHNPPDNGGFKYNPPHGGPAEGEITSIIESRANELMAYGTAEIKRIPYERALKADNLHEFDYIRPYVDDLQNVVDLKALQAAGLKIGVDPLGGSGIDFWDPIAETYGLNLELVNRTVDPSFRFMPLDKDLKIRMDCSSPYAMAGLIELKDKYDIAFGNDPDYDRHGIVTRNGLMNPNHYLAVAVDYLFRNRPQWPKSTAVGKTLVTSSIMDRIAAKLKRPLYEVPVGFKWFVAGLLSGNLGFGGEESAGASFLRFNGQAWTTDKDGIIMDLLAAEITAVIGKTPQEHYNRLTEELGDPIYQRLEAPATPEQKAAFKKLTPDMVEAETLAGEHITAKLTKAPGNDAPLGGLKVVAENGWFAARPSGTEDVYKIYAESFKGEAHLKQLQEEAKSVVSAAFKASGV